MTYEAALLALADPTRRQVFEHLRKGPRAVGDIAAEMPVSRPAVSQHLKVLKEAGLVADQAEGTRRVYSIDPQGLGALRSWLDQFWYVALDAFKAEVEQQPKGSPNESAESSRHLRRARSQDRPRQRRRGPRL